MWPDRHWCSDVPTEDDGFQWVARSIGGRRAERREDMAYEMVPPYLVGWHPKAIREVENFSVLDHGASSSSLCRSRSSVSTTSAIGNGHSRPPEQAI